MSFRHGFALLLVLMLLHVPLPVSAERRVSEETILFRQVRSGVVTVSGDEGSGSGFLVDSTGIVLTNDHVVGGSERIRVKLDDSTRVEARLLASDPKRDVAAIQIPHHIAARLHILHLAQPSDTMIFEGEKVVAIGSPLNQEKIMTAGIVSKVQPTAVISDVNINHGNSGGPLLNMNGEVVAINTFGDFTDQGGPGVSGSILITEAAEVLTKAREMATDSVVPETLLPVPSRTPFPLDTLQAVVQLSKFDSKAYDVSDQVDTGKFDVMIVTPIYQAWRSHEYEQKRAEHLKKREKKGGVTKADASYDPVRQMRDWNRYVGDAYMPVVTVQMTPKYGETGGSVFSNVLGGMAAGLAGTGYRGSHKYEFKADFKDVMVLRNGVEVPDVARGKVFIPLEFARSTWNADYWGEDFARSGIFQCNPDWFAPDSAAYPVIEVRIASVEKPDKPYRFALPEQTVKRVWNDFAAHRSLLVGTASQRNEMLAYIHPESPDSANGHATRAPFTIQMKNGTMWDAKEIRTSGISGTRVQFTDGSARYISIDEMKQVIGSDGTDWTKWVRNGGSVPK